MSKPNHRDYSDQENQPQNELIHDLHQTAQSHYDKLNCPKSSRTTFLWVGFIVLFLVIFSSVYTAFSKDILLNNSDNNLPELFLSELIIAASNSAGNLHTPEAIIEQEEPLVFVETNLQMDPDSGNFSSNLYFPVVSSGSTICSNQAGVRLELVSGPLLDPPLNSKFRSDQVPDAKVTWIIKNTGQCSWNSISLYSLHNGATLHLLLQRDGNLINLNEGLVIAEPGMSLEIMATFDGKNAKEISEEWVLVINGLQSFTQPHLELSVNRWIIVQEIPAINNKAQSSGPSSTPGVGNPKDNPTDGNQPKPPTRPAPTVPARP